MGEFSPGAKVVVEALDDNTWRVREPFAYTNRAGATFRVEAGMETDFASVPRVFVWFLPRYGRYTLAAILHDHLWRNEVGAGTLDYLEADATFRCAMRTLGVPFLRRWIMWAGVRWGALLKPDGLRGWWREAWRVLPVTALAVPVVVPPAVMITIALVLFQLLELAVWVALKLSQRAQRARGKAPKPVNRPVFNWRL